MAVAKSRKVHSKTEEVFGENSMFSPKTIGLSQTGGTRKYDVGFVK
ncbi:hypothetical protein LINPERHAP1_LOCUS17826, partial [Linum perenne]